MRTLAVIPARGGSKRLPRKNIRNLVGHPMLAYTIQAAQLAEGVTDYLVSTEDEEIRDAALKYSAPVPFLRPDSLAGDKVRNMEVIRHALDFMEEQTGSRYDAIILLQPTSPVRDPKHIDEAISLLATSGMDTVAAVKGPFKKRDPIIKAIRDGVLESYCGAGNDHEAFYTYNAALYGMKRSYFVETGKHISEKQAPLIMDQYHSIDVDTEADFDVAEVYVKKLNKHKFEAK